MNKKIFKKVAFMNYSVLIIISLLILSTASVKATNQFDIEEYGSFNYFVTNKADKIEYNSRALVTDPDDKTPCGSQINLFEKDISVNNKSYRNNFIIEGFTRLLYFDVLYAPSTSRLDYYWYSSDDTKAVVTDYGTVIALSVDTTTRIEIMAVYKYDTDRIFVKPFNIYNDPNTYETAPLEFNLELSVEVDGYKSINLKNTNVPVDILHYYIWTSDNLSLAEVSYWGRIHGKRQCLGNSVNIQGVYRYNERVRISITVIGIMPLSGGELPYQPEIWNYNPVLNKTNCYAYALNCQVFPNSNTLVKSLNPGHLANMPDLTKEQINKDYILYCIQMDAENAGFIFEEIGKFEKCSENSYKVALVLHPGNDFHWYRQNPDGTWSHKLASFEAENLDASGNLIYDPENADRYYTDNLNYSLFIGFYEVSPLNTMYVHE